MSYLSLTTWSLHRLLGPLHWTNWDEQAKEQVTKVDAQPQVHSLLELPRILSAKGYQAMEVIHPHFPSTDEAYLKQLRKACEEAGIRFYSLLIDYGDITSADPVRRNKDMNFIKRWIDIAQSAGAEYVRVIGGESEHSNKEALALAAKQLNELNAYANAKGVKVMTENFRSLTSTAENCLYLLNFTEIGLTSDFGNFSGPEKRASLHSTIPKSQSIHAKAQVRADGEIDETEFESCMDIVKEAKYEGPITIVYDGPKDMWQGIEDVRRIVERYI
ncbi:sugar phosphate isomerase/epimerase family protein [Shouchella patagoniensis]|uniref:sugar phosphate isomerase/epimerase family protein n=1 Tax=Shouchella patagoniensis TaxID=228576 RepID=UPI000995CFA4|nr:TIM barrel protein [Shouchella patagoniensis]